MMIISKTPLRISFVGGGTDIASFYTRKNGCVLSTGIDKFVYVIIQKRFDNLVVVNYSKKEIVSNVNEVQHDLVREAMKKAGIFDSVEITTLSDIHSKGSGLGSSSAITVGLLNAFYSFQGLQKSNREIAEDACDIEINILKNPIGKQDQYAAAFGGLHRYEFCHDGQVIEKRIDLNEELTDSLDEQLFLVYTGVVREANNILKEQGNHAEDNFKQLSKIVAMPDQLIPLLKNGDLNALGTMLHENWMIKKTLASSISLPEIDSLYQLGCDAGAVGGKLLGAGGGGFILFYVPTQNVQEFKKKVSVKHRILPIHLEKAGTRIVFYD